jgi:hypothetical protein
MLNRIAQSRICFVALAMVVLPAIPLAAQPTSSAGPTSPAYRAMQMEYAKADFQFLQSISPDGTLINIMQPGDVLEGKVFSTPQARQAAAAKAIPALNRMLSLTSKMELMALEGEKKWNAQCATFYEIIRLALDDPTAKKLNAQAIAAGGGSDAPLANVTGN